MNPGKAAGNFVRTAVTAAHPIVGAVAGKAIARGTETLVNKGFEVAKSPEVRAKAAEISGSVGRQARTLGAAGIRKLGEFRMGHGK